MNVQLLLIGVLLLWWGQALAQVTGLTPGDSVTVLRPLPGVTEYRDRHGNRTTVYDHGNGLSTYSTHPSYESSQRPQRGQIYDPFYTPPRQPQRPLWDEPLLPSDDQYGR